MRSKTIYEDGIAYRVCSNCDKKKEENKDNFYYRGDRNQPYAYCKICFSEINKEWQDKNIDKAKELGRNNYIKNREDIKKRHKNYYYNNKDKFKELHKVWNKNNKGKNSERHKKYYEDNKLKIRKRERERIKIDPVFKIRKRVSNIIRMGLKKNNRNKNGISSWRNLPYTPREEMIYLEFLFEPGMTWENWGTVWHRDHIVPQSATPYDSYKHPNFLKTESLENIRPLWAKDNLVEGNRRTKEEILKIKESIKIKISSNPAIKKMLDDIKEREKQLIDSSKTL